MYGKCVVEKGTFIISQFFGTFPVGDDLRNDECPLFDSRGASPAESLSAPQHSCRQFGDALGSLGERKQEAVHFLLPSPRLSGTEKMKQRLLYRLFLDARQAPRFRPDSVTPRLAAKFSLLACKCKNLHNSLLPAAFGRMAPRLRAGAFRRRTRWHDMAHAAWESVRRLKPCGYKREASTHADGQRTDAGRTCGRTSGQTGRVLSSAQKPPLRRQMPRGCVNGRRTPKSKTRPVSSGFCPVPASGGRRLQSFFFGKPIEPTRLRSRLPILDAWPGFMVKVAMTWSPLAPATMKNVCTTLASSIWPRAQTR